MVSIVAWQSSSLYCNISHSFCSLSYKRVCFIGFQWVKVSVDAIGHQKSSNGDKKLEFFWEGP